MWKFDGEYTGEAKDYIQKRKKKEAELLFWLPSSLILVACLITELFFNIKGTIVDDIIFFAASLLGTALIGVIAYVEYNRAPKNKIEIMNDGVQFISNGYTCSMAFYKIAPIEYHDDFIVLCSKVVLQKELLVEGDWEELKLLLKKVEESLETDEPMYQIEEPEAQFFDATVKSKRIYQKFVTGVSMVTPVGLFEYFATFKLENDQEVEYAISREWYENIEEGQTGQLVIINENFFSFGNAGDLE